MGKLRRRYVVSYQLNISHIDLAENNNAFYMYAATLDPTHGVRQGALRIDMDRPVTDVMTASDGNPDTAFYVNYNQYGPNAAFARGRGAHFIARARASMVWLKGITVGVRNDSGSIVSSLQYGMEIVMENYGSLAGTGVFAGLSIQNQQEAAGGLAPLAEYGIQIKNSNGSVAQAMTAGIKFIRDNAVNTGFMYLIDATGTNIPIPATGAVMNLKDDSTIVDANGAIGAHAGFIIVAIDGVQFKIETRALV